MAQAAFLATPQQRLFPSYLNADNSYRNDMPLESSPHFFCHRLPTSSNVGWRRLPGVSLSADVDDAEDTIHSSPHYARRLPSTSDNQSTHEVNY